MTKLSKSWTVVLATLIPTLLSLIAGVFGVDIPDGTSESLIAITGIVIAAGTVNAVSKRKAKSALPDDKHEAKFTHIGRYYQTNLKGGEAGNMFKYGDPYLYVKMLATKSYTTVKLMKGDKLIQVEQSGAGETARLEMYEKLNGVVQPMAKGEYSITVTGDRGTSDSTGITDKFQIV